MLNASECTPKDKDNIARDTLQNDTSHTHSRQKEETIALQSRSGYLSLSALSSIKGEYE
jgi:hypothetical protein